MINFIQIVIAFMKGIPTILALIAEIRKIFDPQEKKSALESIKKVPEKDLPMVLNRIRARRRKR